MDSQRANRTDPLIAGRDLLLMREEKLARRSAAHGFHAQSNAVRLAVARQRIPSLQAI
jgi:hypothetical protein